MPVTHGPFYSSREFAPIKNVLPSHRLREVSCSTLTRRRADHADATWDIHRRTRGAAGAGCGLVCPRLSRFGEVRIYYPTFDDDAIRELARPRCNAAPARTKLYGRIRPIW